MLADHMMLQARFTEALMRDKAKLDFSADRILSTAETGQPKSEVLQQLEQRHPGMSYHFVEDKLGTLNKVCSIVPCTSMRVHVGSRLCSMDCLCNQKLPLLVYCGMRLVVLSRAE